jgi:hypothetical protein
MLGPARPSVAFRGESIAEFASRHLGDWPTRAWAPKRAGLAGIYKTQAFSGSLRERTFAATDGSFSGKRDCGGTIG